MDHLQTLEFQLAALQRKIRLLQDLRFFFETASAEELAGFGDELRGVVTASGRSVGSLLAALLGAADPATAAEIAASRGGFLQAGQFGSPAYTSPREDAYAGAAAQVPSPSSAPVQLGGVNEARAARPAAGPLSAPGAAGTGPAAGPSAASGAASAPGAAGTRPAAGPSAASGAAGTGAASAPGAGPSSAPGAAANAAASSELVAEALASIETSMKNIPAGSFVMGSETGSDAEKPPHTVSLSAYRVCDHLATNREYALFVRARPEWSKDRADPELRDENYLSDWTGDRFPEGKEEHPVAFVSYHAAEAFASWLGKRLPTEAEWECAARGGLVGKKYPNGDQMNDKLANLAKQYKGTTPVRSFEPNGFGLYDMAGNLFEWTSDWYGPYSAGDARDPAGPAEGEYRVVRGGSWMSGAGALKVSARVDMESVTCGQVGIRLVDRLPRAG